MLLESKLLYLIIPGFTDANGLLSQTNPIAWKNLPQHWNFTLFYTLWICIEFVFVYFVYVETKGPTLEEVARIFDGDEAVAHIDITQVEKELRTSSVDQHEEVEHRDVKM